MDILNLLGFSGFLSFAKMMLTPEMLGQRDLKKGSAASITRYEALRNSRAGSARNVRQRKQSVFNQGSQNMQSHKMLGTGQLGAERAVVARTTASGLPLPQIFSPNMYVYGKA